jgi:hypothetical protein
MGNGEDYDLVLEDRGEDGVRKHRADDEGADLEARLFVLAQPCARSGKLLEMLNQLEVGAQERRPVLGVSNSYRPAA